MSDSHTSIRSRDDLGALIELAQPPRRLVSLVPSWTETLFALGLECQIVGVTKFCPVPTTIGAPARIGGTKNPDLQAILALAPDLVIANAEENRRAHVEWLRRQGIPVFVTYVRTVSGAVRSLAALGHVVGRRARAAVLVRNIRRAVRRVQTALSGTAAWIPRVFCPIWKTPWMTFNADTYANDVLRLMRYANIFAADPARYPRTTLEEALRRQPDVIVLPDEPYPFDAGDAAALAATLPPALRDRVVLISGRDLHWYGVHMVLGLPALAEHLGRTRTKVV